MPAWKFALRSELLNARAARSRGNEGRARVCARRAAGIAIREYLRLQGMQVSSTNAMDLFSELGDNPSASTELREILAHLSMRVDPDFKLPSQIDLIAEAQHLCDLLLPNWGKE
jgi:hypothetical protein